MAEQDPKRQYVAKRRAARKLALIAIYQWQMTGNTYTSIYAGIQEDKELVQDFLRSDAAFFQSLTKYVLENVAEVDAQLKPFLDRDAEHLDQIERAVLRMATAELLKHPETPFKVVVNEAVNLTKKFGADKAYKFVNGVLDKVAGAVRKDRK
ncbi:MAG: transcription antitermination factor NusB [Aquificaceae bacterium]|nr:MAG: transcription antitermination factor NusB [Aquificaceae bacterium]